MPGNDTVIKQNVLGTLAGIALLIFALAYRFLPSFGGGPNVNHEPAPQEPIGAPIWVQAPPQSATAATPVPAPTTSAAVPAAPSEPAVPAPPPRKEIVALLKKAERAFVGGRLVEPKETSALALYQKVLDGDSGNAEAKAGIEKIHHELLDEAKGALERYDDADAERSIRRLAALPEPDSAELDELRARLKVQKAVAPLLTHAAVLLRQGHGTTPPDRSALDAYREVLKLDAGNKLALQGLGQVQRGYLDHALAAAAQDDFAGAETALGEATPILPGSQELLDTRTRIESIRRQRASAMLAQASSALDAGNPELAQLLAQRALGLSSDVPGVDEFNVRLRNARLYASYKPGQIFNDRFLDRSGSAPPVIVIPTGTFIMGSPDTEAGRRSNEEPQHEVQIAAGFALGQDEVTVAQFRAFVDDADYQTDAEKLGGSSVYDEESGRMIEHHGASWRDDYLGERAGDNLPVINVSWNDAHAYVSWLAARTGKKYRLPSEAELEYALRAGSAGRYAWGDGNPVKVYENLTGDGDRSPHLHRSWAKAFPHYNDGHWGPAPVGSFPPNQFGLQDMNGNVSDWAEDCWHDSYTRAPNDGSAWVNPGCAERVVRGGSWGSAPDQARAAFRLAAPPETRSARVGIRIARDL